MSLIDKKYEFDCPLNVNEVFNRIMSVANNIPGMKFKGNPNPLTILLKTGISMSSWGEKVTITCQEIDPMHTRVAILNKPVVVTTLFDWGKGGRNIKKVIGAIEKVLPLDINNEETKSKKKLSKKLFISSMALLLLLLAGSVLWIYKLYNSNKKANIELNNSNIKIDELQKKVESLNIQIDTTLHNLDKEMMSVDALKKENDSLKTLYPIYITKIEVANVDSAGKNISSFGKEISAANSMYLMPRITYRAFNSSKSIELKVRLYGADGKCVTGDTSPKGYSYSYKINDVSSGEYTLLLSGWGGSDPGHFGPGTYRYEVWYNEMCLKSITFKLK